MPKLKKRKGEKWPSQKGDDDFLLCDEISLPHDLL